MLDGCAVELLVWVSRPDGWVYLDDNSMSIGRVYAQAQYRDHLVSRFLEVAQGLQCRIVS